MTHAVSLTRSSSSSADESTLRAADAANNRRRARREALCLSALLAVVSAAAIFGLWMTGRSNEKEAFRRYVSTLAEVAAAQVDPELHERIRRPEQLNSPEYVRAVAPLRALLHTVPELHYAYTLVWDGHDLRFVLDSGDPRTLARDGTADQAAVWQRFDIDDPGLQLQVMGIGYPKPVTLATPDIVSDHWGSFLSAFAPIRDARGRVIACAGVAVDASVYVATLRALRNRALLGLLPAGLLTVLLGIGFYWIRSRGLMMESLLVDAAQKDKLTGLPNRRVFMDRLGQALARLQAGEQTRFTVLFVDFDRFKIVNDTMGHDAGDELLRQIGRRLAQYAEREAREAPHREIVVSRFGGDEFLILSSDPQSTSDSRMLAQGLLETLAAPYEVFGTQIRSMASIGLVTSDRGEITAEEIVRHADMAMYEAKRRGRGCWVEFDVAMRERLVRNAALQAGLRRAIGTPELYLEYQPVINLRTRERVGVEALLRWRHPTLGLILPAELLPIAEDAGLIGALGGWVLKEGCQAMAIWRRQNPARAPHRISINVWRTQLAHEVHLLAQVEAALQSAGLPPDCLQLEFAQDDLARDPLTVAPLVRGLHALGVRLAMDAFGCATSAVGLLRDLPFDTVNIDRTLFADLGSDSESTEVVRTTLRLVESFGMASVAHGVEDIEQLAVLESLGCVSAMGFSIGPPVEFHHVLEPPPGTSAIPDTENVGAGIVNA